MFEYFWILLICVLVVAGVGLVLWGIKHAIALAVNSIIGYFALYAVQAFAMPDLIINIWSVLLVAVLGLVGLILVVILSMAGIWF